MTIFRSKFTLFLALSSLFAQGIGAQASSTAWTMTYSDSEGLQKLLFVSKGENHGEVYLRCRPGEGWIFLIHDVDIGTRRSMVVRSGSASLSPSVSREYDEVDGTHYFDAAIASTDAVIENFGNGKSLVVDGVSYPIRSRAEQNSVVNFIKICGPKE